jgi:hypothetical protein
MSFRPLEGMGAGPYYSGMAGALGIGVHGLARCVVPALSAMLMGCASPSLWEAAYTGVGPDDSPGHPPPRVRDVPWDRLHAAREELGREATESDTHPEAWPPERREAAKAKLLRALQVVEYPASIEVLGRSEFTTTRTINPDDGELSAFGRRLGASRVIWSSRHLGKADTIVSEPVTTYVVRHDWTRGKGGKRRYEPVSYHTTTWVPVTIRADEHAWVAYFLRDRTP